MTMPDAFSAHYQDQLDGHYDCVDRIALNAYNYYAQSGGGFRCWWRKPFGGDDKLDDTHLMRFAGRFARRIRAFAEARGIPLIECRRGERKHELAEPHQPADPDFQGVFCILVGRAPAPHGFSATDHATQVRQILGADAGRHQSRQASDNLKNFAPSAWCAGSQIPAATNAHRRGCGRWRAS